MNWDTNFLTGRFKNYNYNEAVQLIVAFTFGVIFSPFSIGMLWFLIFIIAYEIFYGWVVGFKMPFWRPFARLGIVCASILGWITGRLSVGRPIR